MYIQTLKNAVLFFGTLFFWLVLITIEVFADYSGAILQILYGTSLFALLVAFWLVNRPVVQNIKNEFLQLFSSGAIAIALLALYVFVAVVIGSGYKRLIEGWV
jgi:hypothetical protein